MDPDFFSWIKTWITSLDLIGGSHPDPFNFIPDPQPCLQYLAGGVESLPYDEVDDAPGEDEGPQQVPVHAAQVGHAARNVQHSSTRS